MNVITTDKFDAHFLELNNHEIATKLEKLRDNLKAVNNIRNSILSSKSRKIENEIYVLRLGKYRVFWTMVNSDIIFLDVTRRSWLRW